MTRALSDSYKKKLSAEEGYVVSRSGELRIALCYPNTHAIGMANLGLHTMYELFNSIPDVVCERVFLPDPAELAEDYSPPLLRLASVAALAIGEANIWAKDNGGMMRARVTLWIPQAAAFT